MLKDAFLLYKRCAHQIHQNKLLSVKVSYKKKIHANIQDLINSTDTTILDTYSYNTTVDYH